MNRTTLVGGAIAVAVLLIGVVAFYVLRPAPEEASIANALDAVASDAEVTGAAALQDASGTWTVSTDIGLFDFADATSTFAGFRVDEELRTVGQSEAVGRTPALSGELEIDGTTLTNASIIADFTAIESDVPRRDNAMREALGVDTNPTSTFVLSQPVEFGEVPESGQSLTFTALGDLTVNGMTEAVEVDMEAQVADGNILVVGRAPVVFADYGIQAPVLGPVVSIADNGTIEMQLWFVPAGA